jgi:hypothetical protein
MGCKLRDGMRAYRMVFALVQAGLRPKGGILFASSASNTYDGTERPLFSTGKLMIRNPFTRLTSPL